MGLVPSLAFVGLLAAAWMGRQSLLEALDLAYLLPPDREAEEPLDGAGPPGDGPESSSAGDLAGETAGDLAGKTTGESADDAANDPALVAGGDRLLEAVVDEAVIAPASSAAAASGLASTEAAAGAALPAAETQAETQAAVQAGSAHEGVSKEEVSGSPSGRTVLPAATTHGGLTRYGAAEEDSSFSADLSRHLADPAAVQAFEAAPDDPARRDALIESLLADGAVDRALERAVQSSEESGASDDLHAFSVDTDPWRTRKAEVLLRAAESHLSAGEEFVSRELWLNAGAMLDGASALLSAVTLETGWDDESDPALTVDRAAIVARRDALHGDLWRTRNAIRALAQAGAAVPEAVSTDSRLVVARAEQLDLKVAARGGEHRQTSRHYVVTSTMGSRLVSQASDVLEAAYARASERFSAAPQGTGRAQAVHIVDDTIRYHTLRRRQDPEPPTWPGAFHDAASETLVVLDPRLAGGDLDSLWQLLARESARLVLEGLPPAERTLAPWLSWALAFQFEGARIRADGTVDLDPLPGLRRAQVSAAFGGWGEHRPSVTQVLAMNNSSATMAPWAWVLLTYLDEAGGGAIWDGAVDALLQSYREGTALSAETEFRKHILRAPGAAEPKLTNFPAFERAWVAWLEDWLWIERGEPSALQGAVERADVALNERRWDVSQRLIERVLSVEPGHPGALQLASRLADRRGRADAALLAARWIASVRMGPAGALEAEASPPPASARGTEAMPGTMSGARPGAVSDAMPMTSAVRFAEMSALHGDSALAASRAEATLRGPLADLARQLSEEGWPLAGLRMVDRGLAAAPLDVELAALREELVNTAGGESATLIRRRPQVIRSVEGLHGELHLWVNADNGLHLQCADRVEPTTLRGVVPLSAPCTVRIRLTFHGDDAGRLDDDGKRFVGLLFGAGEPLAHGSWGVFISPDGRLELATQGGLEWPSTPVGKSRRREIELSVSLWGDHITLKSPGKLAIQVPRGSRPADGWLSLFGRRVDATIAELEVIRSRRADPRAVWFTKGGG